MKCPKNNHEHITGLVVEKSHSDDKQNVEGLNEMKINNEEFQSAQIEKKIKGNNNNTKAKSPINDEEDLLNLSGNCARSIEYETREDNSDISSNNSLNHLKKNENILLDDLENQQEHLVDNSEELNIKELKEKITAFEDENLNLKKENLILIQELNNAYSEISKISYEKLILYTEINELLNSLKKIDLNLLNNFYLQNIDFDVKCSNKLVYSAMGIKYNILSASASLGFNSVIDILATSNKTKNGNANKEACRINQTLPSENKNNKEIINEKSLSIIKEKISKYEEELNNYVFKPIGDFLKIEKYRNDVRTNQVSKFK